MDVLSHFVFGVSTVVIGLLSLPLLLAPVLLSFGAGVYLEMESHEAVFGGISMEPALISSGVFSRLRYPIYLGTLLICLAFVFAMLSLLSLVIWIVLFAFYDRMATYEENDLVRVISEEYIAYRERVPKWFPRMGARR